LLVSRQVIAEDLGHLPKEVLRKVVRENVIKLHDLKFDRINNRAAARRGDKTKPP
jgi:4-alpha-glucanotransferase